MGGPAEAMNKLKATVKPGGYIMIEEGFISGEDKREKVRYNRDVYFTEQQWVALFKEKGLELIETVSGHSEGNLDNVTGMAAITARAGELIEKYPDKRTLFEGYIRNQQNEYADIDDSLVYVTWVLRKP